MNSLIILIISIFSFIIFIIINNFQKEKALFEQKVATLEVIKQTILKKIKLQNDSLIISAELDYQIKCATSALNEKIVNLNYTMFEILTKKQ
jgi:hypothetical protein